jgi:formylglycine-generating enzyme required for sulfatase activity
MEGNVWEWSVSPDSDGKAMANRRGGSWADCDKIVGGPGREDSPLIGLSICFGIPVELDHRYDDIGFRCVRPQP